jgi:hypothetical protein
MSKQGQIMGNLNPSQARHLTHQLKTASGHAVPAMPQIPQVEVMLVNLIQLGFAQFIHFISP